MKYLNELFDKPLPVKRSRSLEKELDKDLKGLGISHFKIFQSKLGLDTIRFYVCFVGGKHYEIHFSNSANDHDIIPINVYKNNEFSRIIATAIQLTVEQLKNKTIPVLVYGDNKRKTELYAKAVKSKFPTVKIKKVENVEGLDGSVYQYGFYAQADTRTFKLENVIIKDKVN